MTVEITIDSFGSHGEGVGRHEGLPIFVEGALPGERIRVKLKTVRATYAKGEIDSILTKSASRTEPPCPYYARCGGCQLQHLSYTGQLEMKQQRVMDALKRIGHITTPVSACLPAPTPFHYRNKIQLAFSNHKELGLNSRGSHEIVPIEQCMIHCESGERAFSAVKSTLNHSTGLDGLHHVIIRTANGENLVLMLTSSQKWEQYKKLAEAMMKKCPTIKGVVACINRRPDNEFLFSEHMLLSGQDSITETICGLRFKVSPASFFQINSLQAENLYRIALDFAELHKEATLLDAYCGVGTLALIAAKKVKAVIGIEIVKEAIADAKENAENNKVENSKFICAAAENAIEQLSKADVVLLNPPRKGCHAALMEALLEQAPQRIVYVSCDPATLARDLKTLTACYSIDQVQPVDMFPETAHVETVVKLTSKGSN